MCRGVPDRALPRGVTDDDLLLQLSHPGGWFEAEFFAEPGPEHLVGAQRVGLTRRSIQREHQLSRETLAQRMLADERGELRDEFTGEATLEVCIEPELDRFEPHLLETADLGLGEGPLGEVLADTPPPQRQ